MNARINIGTPKVNIRATHIPIAKVVKLLHHDLLDDVRVSDYYYGDICSVVPTR